MHDAELPPSPGPLLSIGWPRLLLLVLLTGGTYSVYWYRRRGRELAALGLDRTPLALGAGAAGLLIAATYGLLLAQAAWPGSEALDALDPYVVRGLTVGTGVASLLIAGAFRRAGTPASGLWALIFRELYLEERLLALPVGTRPWTRADWRTAAGPAAVFAAFMVLNGAIVAVNVGRIEASSEAVGVALEAEDLAAAARHAEDAIALNPELVPTRTLQVLVDLRAGRIAEGLAHVEAALALAEKQKLDPWADQERLAGNIEDLRALRDRLRQARKQKDPPGRRAPTEAVV